MHRVVAASTAAQGAPGEDCLGPCPICGRPMIPGPSVDRHHWTPRREGGGDRSWLHRICHKKLHSLFTERELAELYPTAEALRAHPEIATFVRWARKQPPGAVGRHATPRARRK